MMAGRRWYGDFRSPISAWAAWITWREEKERGLVHTDEWNARMEELGETLRKTQDDLRILERVDDARGAFNPADGLRGIL